MDSSGLYVNRWKKIPNMFQLECGSSVYLGESIIVQDLESRTFQVNTSISVDQNFPNFVTATESFRRIRYNIFDLPFFWQRCTASTCTSGERSSSERESDMNKQNVMPQMCREAK